MTKLAGTPNNINYEHFQHVQERETHTSLDDPLTEEEYRGAIKAMRESAGGDDEVTISMWREADDSMQTELLDMVKRLWNTALRKWVEEVHRAVVILL